MKKFVFLTLFLFFISCGGGDSSSSLSKCGNDVYCGDFCCPQGSCCILSYKKCCPKTHPIYCGYDGMCYKYIPPLDSPCFPTHEPCASIVNSGLIIPQVLDQSLNEAVTPVECKR